MLSPPVPIPIASYILAYHLKSQDASPAPYACRASRARHRQISNGRLYLPLLCFCCDCFRVFANARHRAHAGATFFVFYFSYVFSQPQSRLSRLSFARRLTAVSRSYAPKTPVRLRRRRGAIGADYKNATSFAWQLTLASRRFTPKAPVRLHKRSSKAHDP